MSITSISLSYIFLAIAVISIAFFLYFKTLIIKSSKNSEDRNKIIGNMKDPVSWAKRNNIMSYISLFWSILSIVAFIYLKYFYGAPLVSIIYLFIYVALIAASLLFIRVKKTTTS